MKLKRHIHKIAKVVIMKRGSTNRVIEKKCIVPGCDYYRIKVKK